MVVNIYIGELKLDMFQDENVELNTSIASAQDITKNTTDFTKSFTVPSSNNNDSIFKHYYDVNIDNGFDARIKVNGKIELDGMPFKLGKWKLHKVKIKKGQPSSYTINFTGQLIDLKDTLGKDELSLLDLSAFNHDYNSANVKLGLETSLFSGDLVYNSFVKRQLYYNSDVTDTTIEDNLINIAWGDGSGSNGLVWNDLRPSIKIIKLIEAIETKYTIANGYQTDLVFSRDFFGRSEFTDIYAWLNPSKDIEIPSPQVVVFDGGDTDNINFATGVGSFEITDITPFAFDYESWQNTLTLTPSVGFEQVQYTMRVYLDGEVHSEMDRTGTRTFSQFLKDVPNNTLPYTFTMKWEVECLQEFSYTTSLQQDKETTRYNTSFPYHPTTTVQTFTTTSSGNTIISVFKPSLNIPKMKTIDFLKGLFNAFKLVVIPLEDGTLYVNTLDDYYAEGSVHNVTEYIDFDNHEVARGDLLNEINYLYKEPTTILNKTFEENTGIGYGDQETILKDDDGKLIDGKTLKFTLPFEQILYERLNDLNDNELTNIQYGAIIDESLAPVNPKMHLFYNIPQPISTKTIGFIDDSGTKLELNGSINTPSHSITFDSPNYSLLFDREFSSWNSLAMDNTLYTNYHKNYIESIFNAKRRNFKYTAVLPLILMLKIRLNDVLKIKDNYYRIDNFKTNLITGKATLNLINSFGSIKSLTSSNRKFYLDSSTQTVSTYITELDGFIKVDLGGGTSWITVTSIDKNVYFDVDENTGGQREMIIKLINKSDTVEIYINQSAKNATFDSTTFTFDSTKLTFDNI